MAVDPITTEAAEAAAPTAPPAISAPVVKSPSKFASVHTLLMRIDDPAELLSDAIWLRDEMGVLQQRMIRNLSPEKERALHAAIAAGQVYIIWGHRYKEMDELEPAWHRPGAVPPATEA